MKDKLHIQNGISNILNTNNPEAIHWETFIVKKYFSCVLIPNYSSYEKTKVKSYILINENPPFSKAMQFMINSWAFYRYRVLLKNIFG